MDRRSDDVQPSMSRCKRSRPFDLWTQIPRTRGLE